MSFLFFDLETRARLEALSVMPDPKPPAGWKDPDKIAEFIADKKAQRAAEAALDPDTGQISALAYSGLGQNFETVHVIKVFGSQAEAAIGPEASEQLLAERITMDRLIYADPLAGERALVDRFWTLFDLFCGRTCGYNILGFDLPYLLRRSFGLEVKPRTLPSLARYRSDPVCDLYALLYNWGPGKGLKTVCQLYGIPNPLPELNGAQVATMDWLTEVRYAANDVRLTMALCGRMKGIYFPDFGPAVAPRSAARARAHTALGQAK